MTFLRKFVLHSPGVWIAAAVTGLVLAFLYLVFHGFDLLFYYMDALSLAGAALILMGLLGMTAYFGAFDTFGYAFSTFVEKRRYKDLYEYTQAKQDKRSHGELSFMPFILVGALLLAVGLLLRLAI